MAIDYAHFTPLTAWCGGMLIGLAVAMLLWLIGRIAGISGIVGGLLAPRAGDKAWRVAFVVGMLLSPWLYPLFHALPQPQIVAGPWRLIVAGLLVGYGSRLGSGCTSGHGVCGLARFSPRSSSIS